MKGMVKLLSRAGFIGRKRVDRHAGHPYAHVIGQGPEVWP